MKVKGIKDGGIALDLILKIHNPNSRSFKVKKATFDIYVDNANVGKSTMNNAIKIEANSTNEYVFPMIVKLNGENLSLGLILNTVFQKKILLKIDGTIKAGTILINQSFEVDWEEEISL